jgi:membrane-associated phospholipid phosphatase
MIRKKNRVRSGMMLLLNVITFSCISLSAIEPRSEVAQDGYEAVTGKKKCCPPHGKLATFIGEIASDVVGLNVGLFSWDTFKIITTFFPLFVGARMFDERVQSCLYDRPSHKNLNQPPAWVHDVLLGSYALFEHDLEKQQAGRLLLLGLPFVIWGKTLLKKINMRACYRPWNEQFSRKRQSLGGLPSGHMSEAMYTAVLFGARFGPKYAVPLGFLAAFLGVAFVACNRHYVSQIVAGAGLGTIYAVAANKVIDRNLCDRWSAGMECDANGTPLFSLGCRF